MRTWKEKIDRTKPTIELSGSLARPFEDPRFEGLYNATYELNITGRDGDGTNIQAGVTSVKAQLRKPDGDAVLSRSIEQPCAASQNCALTLPTFTLNTSEFADGAYVVWVAVKDAAGNETTQEQNVLIDRAGNLVHAQSYTGDPANPDSEFVADEWTVPHSNQARLEDSDSEVTTRTIACDTNPLGCQELRDRSARDGATNVDVTTGDGPGDVRLVSHLPILHAPLTSVAPEEAVGPIAEALQSWQAPPPGHGATYTKTTTQETVDIDGEPTTISRTRWIDSSTALPLREDQREGAAVSSVFFVYNSARPEWVPLDLFAAGGDPLPTGSTHTVLPAATPPNEPPETPLDTQIEQAVNIRESLGLPNTLDFVRSVLLDLGLPTREDSMDLIGTPLLANELTELRERLQLQGEATDKQVTIVEQYPADYAGAYIDQVTGRLRLGFTSHLTERLQAVRGLFSDSERIEGFQATVSLVALEQLEATIEADWREGELADLGVHGFAIDTAANSLLITVTELSSTTQQALRDRYGAAVSVVEEKLATQAAPSPRSVDTHGQAVGGVEILPIGCTTGLPFYRKTPGRQRKYYTSTAGHCSAPDSRPLWHHRYRTPSGDMAPLYLGRTTTNLFYAHNARDAQLIKVSRRAASPRLFIRRGSRARFARLKGVTDFLRKGSLVCYTGASSGGVCGEVTRFRQAETLEGKRVSGLFEFKAYDKCRDRRGDSGGAVYAKKHRSERGVYGAGMVAAANEKGCSENKEKYALVQGAGTITADADVELLTYNP